VFVKWLHEVPPRACVVILGKMTVSVADVTAASYPFRVQPYDEWRATKARVANLIS